MILIARVADSNKISIINNRFQRSRLNADDTD
jgi:hypothetical protein